MSLKDTVAAWDGKSVDAIARIYNANKADLVFGSQLIQSLGDPDCERGITWLIKHHLEEGWQPRSAEETTALLNALKHTTHWEARLHVLQCLPYLVIPPGQVKPLQSDLQTAIFDDAKFVRAWAYHGLYVLASQHPDVRSSAIAILKQAQETEAAASAKVKIRNALKALGID